MPLDEIQLRPLRDVARDARALGFALAWQEDGDKFRVRLTPVSPGAKEASRRVTPQGVEMAITSSTRLPPKPTQKDRLELIRKTGVEALGIARQLVA